MLLAHLGVIGGDLGAVGSALSLREQLRDDADGARGVRHVHRGAGIVRRDLDGGVGARGGGAADQQRLGEALALHLGGDVGHLLQRGRDEAGQADRIGVVLARGSEDLVGGDHHAEVDHLVVVAGEHHADDVFADVVHVALDGGHDDLALRGRAAGGLLRLDEGQQVGHRLLHDARRLHHLRQEHLAGAEEIADDVHAVHQRALDDVERARRDEARFLRVRDDEVGDALHHGVGEALAHRLFAPGEVLRRLLRRALHAGGNFNQALGGVGAAAFASIKDDVLDALAQVCRDVLVHTELAGIDDAHGESGLDGVVEEDGVDGLAHRVVAAEGERHVRDAAGDLGAGEILADPARRFDEIDGVVVVLGDAGGDGEDVGVEDDVAGREAVLHQQVIAAPADRRLARQRVGLALLVEGHDDHRRAVAPDFARLLEELRLAFLERDGIDDALALQALQAGLDHLPLRGVDHHRHAGDVRLGGDQVEELHHRRLRIEHGLVHVDVDHLRAGAHLGARHGDGLGELAVEDEAGEGLRAGDVGALADVHEQRLFIDVERLQPGQPQGKVSPRATARGDAVQRLRDGGDMRRRRAAAAAGDVDEAGARPVDDLRRQHLRRLVVAGRRQRVGQAGVGVRRDEAVAQAGKFFDVLAQLLRAERAVEAEAQGPRMAERIPEGLRRLAGQRAAGGVGDGAGDHDRQAAADRVEMPLDGVERRLGVQRVEDGLDQDQVGAAVAQAAHRFGVRRHQLVEADVAETGVVHVGRDRGGARGGPEHAGDEARLVRGGIFVGGLARHLRAGDVQLIGERLQPVVGLRDRGGVESVGLDDVGAGGEVVGVDGADRLRLRQEQQIVVALQLLRVILEAGAAIVGILQSVALNHGAHGAVEDEDAPGEEGAEQFAAVGLHGITVSSKDKTRSSVWRTGLRSL
ncbi:MAG: hypothetical protein GAKPKEKM_01531 [Rhodocyclaceae bacterium]|nr:hypothetical protein [Rhodocyclaceae bacterium]